ncbi:alpha/beta fold hydrolase [Kribbella sp. NPDC026596]|uniref:alpha/beta fold hydrolase n=1 Tax=Kribbella sp. NPDC026596 TaxID=3155122 RepID=UPI00340FB0BD
MKVRRVRTLLMVAVLGVGSLGSTAFVSAAESETAAAPAYKIDFSPCPGSANVQCGTLRVPADWAAPKGPKITVAVARRPADDPAHRIGTLFYNPGGPGDPATDNVIAADTFFSATLRARFDIVGVDPRGVGGSTPITCGVPPLTPEYTFFPRTQAAFDAMVAHNRAVARSCLQQTGPLFLHADTVSVARDHEAVRIALGVSKVNWLGLSYGTQVGAQYAALYPKRTRAIVLDAALDHSSPEVQLTADATKTVEEAFDRFADWCDTAADCVLRGQDVRAVYDKLVRDADANPIPVEGALRPVSGDDIRMNTPNWLAAKTPNVLAGELSWPVFSEVLRRAVAGDAQFFAFPAPGGPVDVILASRIANHCGDYVADIHTFAEMQQRIEMGRQLAPHLQGGSEFWQGGFCIGWPFKVANPQRSLDVKGVPTLIVHSTHDPSVSYQWAFGLAAQIRGSSVLSRIGDGHTSYYTSDCARDATDQFLLTTRSTPAPVCAT